MKGGENMNYSRIKQLKEQYPPGTRIQLDHNGRIIRFAENATIPIPSPQVLKAQ